MEQNNTTEPEKTYDEFSDDDISFRSELNEGWYGFQDVIRRLQSVDLGLNETKSAASERIRQTWNGITDVISTTATHIATELEKMEEDTQDDLETEIVTNSVCEERQSTNHSKIISGPVHLMPWEEVSTNNKTTEDTKVKARILQISLEDDTFTGPYNNNNNNIFLCDQDDSDNVDNRYQRTIRSNLLDLDTNLSCAYSKLVQSGIVCEEIFWRNYFYHCEVIRSGKFFKEKGDKSSHDQVKEQQIVSTAQKSSEKNLNPSTDIDSKNPFDRDAVKVEEHQAREVDERENCCEMGKMRTSSFGSFVFIEEDSDEE